LKLRQILNNFSSAHRLQLKQNIDQGSLRKGVSLSCLDQRRPHAADTRLQANQLFGDALPEAVKQVGFFGLM
jgi:hypothetical protein